MLVFTVELLHGTIRCASAEDTTLTGQPSAEWPPSPARLYQALVAADGTGDTCRVTPGSLGLDLLETPPVIRAVGPGDALISAIRPRYVVIDASVEGSVQEYSARKAQTVRPGARVAPKEPLVAYVWPDAVATPEELSALRARCARVGYLGSADSPVRVRVATGMAAVPEALPSWVPDAAGDLPLPVAHSGFLAELDAAFGSWSEGSSRRAAWLPRLLASYRSPGSSPEHMDPTAPCLWYRFDRSLPGRRVLPVTETLRAALLEGADRVAGGRQRVPEVIHGHHELGAKGVEHVRILALPNVGFARSDGRIHGACIWFPPDTPAEHVELARAAIAGVTRLTSQGGVVDVGMQPFDGSRAPVSSNPARWAGPARTWVSAFPVVFERRTKSALTLAELSKWCEWAGLPAPVAFRAARVPLVPGAAALAPGEALRGEPRPYCHIEMTFGEAVRGPIAIGRGRHFGLGLMAPVREHAKGATHE